MKPVLRVKIIGSGGIGTCLIEPIARYLSYDPVHQVEITVIDGDKYEERNRERQRFQTIGNKADETVRTMKEEFPRILWRSIPEYLTDDNIIVNIRELDVIFMCVDNHATRKLVSDRCEELDNVTLISGGNGYTDGDVLLHLRRDGEDVAPTIPITKLDEKISKPEDKNPGSLTDAERAGCQQQAISHPQLLVTNLAIASCMINVYYCVEQGRQTFNRIFVDVLTGRMRPSPESVVTL